MDLIKNICFDKRPLIGSHFPVGNAANDVMQNQESHGLLSIGFYCIIALQLK